MYKVGRKWPSRWYVLSPSMDKICYVCLMGFKGNLLNILLPFDVRFIGALSG